MHLGSERFSCWWYWAKSATLHTC